ncbi:MAG: hypothetical protein L7U87_06200 [Chlamydiales bacterium]|nr:hypothetical protein [Chlamydiales bacterium]
MLTGIALIALAGIYYLYKENSAPVSIQDRVAKACEDYGKKKDVEARKAIVVVLKNEQLKRRPKEYITAQFLFAMMCNLGKGGDKDKISARAYFGEIIKNPLANLSSELTEMYLMSLVEYAFLLMDPDAGEVSMAGAREHYLQLANYSLDEIPEPVKLRYIVSLITLAQMLKDGKGGEMDIEGAKNCFEKIAHYPCDNLPESVQKAMKELKTAFI